MRPRGALLGTAAAVLAILAVSDVDQASAAVSCNVPYQALPAFGGPGYSIPLVIAADGTLGGWATQGFNGGTEAAAIWDANTHAIHSVPGARVYGINIHGHVVTEGVITNIAGNVLVDLSTLVVNANSRPGMHVSGTPNCINSHDVVAGYYTPTSGTSVQNACLYDMNSGTTTDLGAPDGMYACTAIGLNDDGTVIAYADTAGGPFVGYRWTSALGWQTIPAAVAQNFIPIVGIATDGRILCLSGSGPRNQQHIDSFMWHPDGSVDAYQNCHAAAINNNGDFMGVITDPTSGSSYSFVTTGGQTHELCVNSSGGPQFYPTALNDVLQSGGSSGGCSCGAYLPAFGSLPNPWSPDTSTPNPGGGTTYGFHSNSPLAGGPCQIITTADGHFMSNCGFGWEDPVADSLVTYVALDTTLFTEIADFPPGFDHPFHVSVNGIDLGTFGAGDSVVFRNYAPQLGASLIRGGGVRLFTITGISPTVDEGNPLAFPLNIATSSRQPNFEVTIGSATVTGVPPLEARVPGLSFAGCFPNPGRGSSDIRFRLGSAALVTVSIHDVSGRLVWSKAVGEIGPGMQIVSWDGKSSAGTAVSAGQYFVRLRTPTAQAQGSLLLLH